MAEPVRNDEPLSDIRFPEAPRPRPVPVTRAGADSAGLLPEHATDKPLGEWPRETLEDLRDIRRREDAAREPSKGSEILDTIKNKARPVAEFMQDRAVALRRRFRIIRGKLRSGELQDEVKDRATQLSEEASRQARVARHRAEFYARHYPLQFIGSAAAAGFVIGFLLRMGRDE